MTADATLTCLSLMSTLKQSPTEQGGEVGPQGGRNMELPTPTKDKKGPVQVKRPGSNTSAPSRGGGGGKGLVNGTRRQAETRNIVASGG